MNVRQERAGGNSETHHGPSGLSKRCTGLSEQETRCQYVGRGIQVAAILILLCTTLVGCPPRKPTPVATSAVLLDASHAPTGSLSS